MIHRSALAMSPTRPEPRRHRSKARCAGGIQKHLQTPAARGFSVSRLPFRTESVLSVEITQQDRSVRTCAALLWYAKTGPDVPAAPEVAKASMSVVVVCPLSEVSATVDRLGASHLVSLIDVETLVERPDSI